MRKIFLLLCLSFIGIIKVVCQTQSFEILNGNTTIQYLKKENALTAIRNVTVKIEYWSSKDSGNNDNKDKVLKFEITNITPSAMSKPVIGIIPPTILAKDFSTRHKTVSYNIPITISAVDLYNLETFSIVLKVDDVLQKGALGVILQKEPTTEPTNKSPDGFSFINAVNFDFNGNNGASYVGNINLFNPTSFSKKKEGFGRFGYNLGIMKIDFSRNDSLNTSYDYYENVKVKPLDRIIIDTTKYLRQYNKLTTVSKNLTWSFYFQPTFSIICNPEFKLLLHVHTELFIDKWTTRTDISNYQQDSATITKLTSDSLIKNLSPLNKFSKSTLDIVSTTSNSNSLNFNIGLGITLEKSWPGGSLFIQPTIGYAINYARPISIDTKNLDYKAEDNKNVFAHLTRFRLSEIITNNIQAIIGVDVRGKFKSIPTYAAFIGVNVGLEGIKNLIK